MAYTYAVLHSMEFIQLLERIHTFNGAKQKHIHSARNDCRDSNLEFERSEKKKQIGNWNM